MRIHRALIAFHHYAKLTRAILMGTNPFDEYGVERGRRMAKAIEERGEEFDASTEGLLEAAALSD